MSTARIIDGRALAEGFRADIGVRAAAFKDKRGISPALAVIKVGQDVASAIYVNNKIKACGECGIKSLSYFFQADVSQETLIELIETLNEDCTVHGILVQLPLPPHINEQEVLSAISPKKDVDGFHALNAGSLFLCRDALYPCTARAVIELIKSTGCAIAGATAAVVGRSNIVGKPAALMLLSNSATVTVCHSKTQNLAGFTKTADILVAATGKPKLITADMVKQGAVVIDVGINRSQGVLCGDVDFESVKNVAGHITPVPGGVGPMTIAMLLDNCIKAALD